MNIINRIIKYYDRVTLSTLQTKADTFTNIVFPDEMAQLDLHFLPFRVLTETLFAIMDMPEIRNKSVDFGNSEEKSFKADISRKGHIQ